MSQVASPVDNDLQLMTVDELRSYIMRIRDKVRPHQKEKGHDRCWESDAELLHFLYSLLPEGDQSDFTIPPDAEHEERCRLWRVRNRCPLIQASHEKVWEVHVWRPGMYPYVRGDYVSDMITFEKWVLNAKMPGRTPLRLEIYPQEGRTLNYDHIPPKVTVREISESGGQPLVQSYDAYFYRIREDVIMLFSWHNNFYL